MKKQIAILFILLITVICLNAQNKFNYVQTFDEFEIGTYIEYGDGWTNEVYNDQNNWSIGEDTTMSSGGNGVNLFTGPDGDHTSHEGHYFFVEATYNEDERADLLSPEFFVTEDSPISISFWYNMNGPDIGSLHVDIKETESETWQEDIFEISGNQGKFWKQAEISLDSGTVNGNVQIRFRANTINGGDLGDIAIDDFKFWTGSKLQIEQSTYQAHFGEEIYLTAVGGFPPYEFSLPDSTLGELTDNGDGTAVFAIGADLEGLKKAHIVVNDSDNGSRIATVEILTPGYCYHEDFHENVLFNDLWQKDPNIPGENNWRWYEKGTGWWVDPWDDDDCLYYSWWPERENFEHSSELTNSFDMSQQTEAYIIIDAKFSDFFLDPEWDETLSLQASIDSGNTWNTIWEQNELAERRLYVIEATDQIAGAENVQLRMTMEGACTGAIASMMVYEISVVDSAPIGTVTGNVQLVGVPGNQLEGIKVVIGDEEVAETDSNGNYTLDHLVGDFPIEFVYPGFAPELSEVRIGMNSVVEKNSQLSLLGPRNLIANNGYDQQVPLQWTAPYYPLDNAITYDDGVFEGYIGIGQEVYNQGFVTKFDANEYPYEITHVQMNLANQTPFDLIIYAQDPDTGLPGEELLRSAVVPEYGIMEDWITIQLEESITVNSTFYVGYLQTLPIGNWIAIDRDSYYCGNTYCNYQGSWDNIVNYDWADYRFVGNLGIRVASQAEDKILPAYSLNLIKTSEASTEYMHQRWGKFETVYKNDSPIAKATQKNSEVTDYNVYYKNKSDVDWTLYEQNYENTSIDVTGLQNNNEYQFKVCANIYVSQLGETLESASSVVKEAMPNPTGTISGNIDIEGKTDNSNCIISYFNYEDPGFDGWEEFPNYTIEGNGDFIIENLPIGDYQLKFQSQFYKQVQDYNITINMEELDIDLGNVLLKPAAPHSVIAVSYEDGEIPLSWTIDYKDEGELMHDDGTYEWYVRPNEGGMCASAYYFEQPCSIEKIKVPVANPDHTDGIISFKVYQANEQGAPGECIYSSEHISTDNNSYLSYLYLELPEPIPVSENSTLFFAAEVEEEWIGYDLNTYDSGNEDSWIYGDFDYDGHNEWNLATNYMQFYQGYYVALPGTFGIHPILENAKNELKMYDLSQKDVSYLAYVEKLHEQIPVKMPVDFSDGRGVHKPNYEIVNGYSKDHGCIDHFNIYYRETGLRDWNVVQTEGYTEYYVLDGLTNGHNYEFYITAVFIGDNDEEVESLSSDTFDDYFAGAVPYSLDTDYLVIDWDRDSSFSQVVEPLLQEIIAEDETFQVITYAPYFDPTNIPTNYKAIFLSTGIRPNAIPLRDGSFMESYLISYLQSSSENNLHNLYAEGGDLFTNVPRISPLVLMYYLGISSGGCEDGANDLSQIEGINGVWSDNQWNYTTNPVYNNSINHIAPNGYGDVVLRNDVVDYNIGISRQEDYHHTMACSFELAGIETEMEQESFFNTLWDSFLWTLTGTSDDLPINKTELVGNYPNPFNPTTTINFNLKNEAKVKIEIFNIKGQKVKTFASKNMEAGNHNYMWNGNDDNNKPVSSGVYFYKLHTSDDFSSTKKMLLLK